ncbi:MAG: hypothetical protein L0H31_01155 [Nocardioidaceae bacterium]|nr:hypothetical protein [Nocardioidaceae bacterium]
MSHSPENKVAASPAELALPIVDEAMAQRLRERMAAVEADLFVHASSRAP